MMTKCMVHVTRSNVSVLDCMLDLTGLYCPMFSWETERKSLIPSPGSSLMVKKKQMMVDLLRNLIA